VRVVGFDAAALSAHLRRHGIDPGEVRERYGAEGYGPSLYISDPDGNTVELIGNTPMVRLHNVPAEGSAEVIVKLEMFNPLSSVKDRISLSMIEDAEKRGELKRGATIVEATIQ